MKRFTACCFLCGGVEYLHDYRAITPDTNAGTRIFMPIRCYALLASIAFTYLLQKKAESFRKLVGFTSLVYILVQSILRNTWLNTCLSMISSLILASAIEVISSKVHTKYIP